MLFDYLIVMATGVAATLAFEIAAACIDDFKKHRQAALDELETEAYSAGFNDGLKYERRKTTATSKRYA